MLIATLLTAAHLAFAVPQSQSAPVPPTNGAHDAGKEASTEDDVSVEVVAGELVLQASFFETLTDEELKRLATVFDVLIDVDYYLKYTKAVVS